MAGKSKNMNDVYFWIKDTVIPSLNNLEQTKATRELITNFYYQYESKKGHIELSSELEHILIDKEYDFIEKKLIKEYNPIKNKLDKQ